MHLAVTKLTHHFPGRPPLFTDLDITAASGDLIAVVGPSGSGKSTLLGIIAGHVKPVSGTVELRGVSGITWVLQAPYGVARRTVLDHVVFPLLTAGDSRVAAEKTARAALATVGLAQVADGDFGQLSGGEAQRLMLARAMVAAHDVVLIDEPTAQLDPMSATSVIEVLGELAGLNKIVLVATHDVRVAHTCSRMITLGQTV